ncbi:MAG: hypothetical protein ACE5ER_08715, partial [Nitrospinaceae bacterium]
MILRGAGVLRPAMDNFCNHGMLHSSGTAMGADNVASSGPPRHTGPVPDPRGSMGIANKIHGFLDQASWIRKMFEE